MAAKEKQLKRLLDASRAESKILRAELESLKQELKAEREERKALSDQLQVEEGEVFILQRELERMKTKLTKYKAELRHQGEVLELVETNGLQYMLERDEVEKRKKALEKQLRLFSSM